MLENYLVNKTDATFQEWNNNLNYEDMDHDAGNPKNSLYQTCRDSLFNNIEDIDYPDLAYVKPIIIPKKDIYTKPSVIRENFSIRDTEPAEKIGMNEKYTPAYYFDPASRRYPAEFPSSVMKYRNKTIDLEKYGLNVKITFKFMNNNFQEVEKPTVIAATININHKYFKDEYTEYIHKTGYSMAATKSKKQLKIPDNKRQTADEFNHLIQQILILGNGEKDHFFNTNQANVTPDNIKRGQRMILYKLLGDLLHAAFATPEDMVFTLDTYLKDRCRKNGIAVVAKEKNQLDVMFDVKTKLYKVWIDKLYDNGKELFGGTIAKKPSKLPIKKSATKPSAKKAPVKGELTGKEKLLADGRKEVSQYMTVRKTGEKYKKILVSCFNYHIAGEEIPDFYGGNHNEYKELDHFLEYYTLKDVKEHSLAELLKYAKDKIENQQRINQDIIEKINDDKEIDQEMTINTELTFSEGVISIENEMLTLINKLSEFSDEKTMGKSDEMNNLIELLVDKTSMISEPDLETYLIRSICKDDNKSLEVINLLNSLTNDSGLFIYDYRLLNDFIENFDLIKEETEQVNQEIVSETMEEDATENMEESTNSDFSLLRDKITAHTNRNDKYDPTQEDINKYNLLPEEEKREIDSILKDNFMRTNEPQKLNTIFNEPSAISVGVGGKTNKTKKIKRKKQKTNKRKTKRRQIKKNKISKKNKN
jgi:hypothetical protein